VNEKIPYKMHSEIFSPLEVRKVLSMAVNKRMLIANSKGEYFYNVPCSVDIETSSFYRDEFGIQYDYSELIQAQKQDSKFKPEKLCAMYIWQFGINGYVIVGRTWEEFLNVCDEISDSLELNEKRRLIVYVHNLSYEFQFINRLFSWEKIFSIDVRKPIYAITSGFIEFRCSYLLSGYSLAKLSSQLAKYHVEKMVGDLDYSKIRHSRTPMTEKEMRYCVNDVFVVMSYIQEKIEQDKGIQNIPLTKTGYVRRYCRKSCLYHYTEKGRRPNYQYSDLMKELYITDLEEFDTLQRAFAGGFTHANAYRVDEVIPNVASYDFTSSYPYVMFSEEFPMSHAVKVQVKSKQEFEEYLNKYCCIFDIAFKDIITKKSQETPLSVSKCWKKVRVTENNGRVVCAEEVVTTITNVDFNILKMFYSWGQCTVNYMYVYKKGYLPTEFVKSILNLYKKKTELKNVPGMEVEYLNSKEMVNSAYGMCVTNPLRDEIEFNGLEWSEQQPTEDERAELLYKNNHSKNRFLFYPWGVFVTAYARRNLFTGIYAIGDDYIYSDTDSVKLTNYEAHKSYFEAYNARVEIKLKKACEHHGIPFEMVEPKTVKGVSKRLGVWDFEGVYQNFKTLGAKRYMVQKENVLEVDGKKYDFSLTVSGVNKNAAIPYLLERYGKEGIFQAFSDFLDIPPEATGKNLHTYIDYETSGTVIDYLGNEAQFHEKSAVHLEPIGYTLNLYYLYLQYLGGIKFHEQ